MLKCIANIVNVYVLSVHTSELELGEKIREKKVVFAYVSGVRSMYIP